MSETAEGYWWCKKCQLAVGLGEITLEEQTQYHDVCGRDVIWRRTASLRFDAACEALREAIYGEPCHAGRVGIPAKCAWEFAAAYDALKGVE